MTRTPVVIILVLCQFKLIYSFFANLVLLQGLSADSGLILFFIEILLV